MAKSDKNRKDKDEEIILGHLGGFARKGAKARSTLSVPTGHFDLDFAIHYGELPGKIDLTKREDYDPKKPIGLPMGRMVELFGPPAGGKSSLAYRLVFHAQQMNLPCLWIDTEHSFDERLAGVVNGVDIDRLLYSELFDVENPDKSYTAEDVFDNVIRAVEAGVKLVVVDSLPSLIPKDRMEKDAEKVIVARLARLGSDYIPKVVHFVAKNDALLVVINQIRTKPGIMFGPTEDSPGGWAIKHNSSVRLCITQRGGTKEENYLFIEDDEVDGGRRLVAKNSYVQIVKNRMSKPLLDHRNGKHVSVDIPIYYEPYFPNMEEILFNMGRKMKLVKVRTGVYSWDGHKVEGKEAFIEYLKENSLVDELGCTILEAAKEQGMALPPELLKAKFNTKKTKAKSIGKDGDKTP